jgi:uncharacterized protein (TIGR03067 family)
MARLYFLAACAVSLAAGCDFRTDRQKLQGQWQLYEMRGWFEFDLPMVQGGPTILPFAEDGFIFQNCAEQKQRVSGIFACDTSARPSRITFTVNGRTVVGIYSVSNLHFPKKGD